MTQKTWFTAFLLVLTGLLLAESLVLSPLATRAPFWVLVPTLALLGLQLSLDLRPSLLHRRRILRDSLLDVSAQPPSELVRRVWKAEPGERHQREIRLALWIALLVGGLYLVGLALSAAVFLLAYLRTEAGVGWRGSVLITAATLGVMYLAFGVLVPVPLPEPLLF